MAIIENVKMISLSMEKAEEEKINNEQKQSDNYSVPKGNLIALVKQRSC